jgi:hypothetical protein
LVVAVVVMDTAARVLAAEHRRLPLEPKQSQQFQRQAALVVLKALLEGLAVLEQTEQ